MTVYIYAEISLNGYSLVTHTHTDLDLDLDIDIDRQRQRQRQRYRYRQIDRYITILYMYPIILSSDPAAPPFHKNNTSIQCALTFQPMLVRRNKMANYPAGDAMGKKASIEEKREQEFFLL